MANMVSPQRNHVQPHFLLHSDPLQLRIPPLPPGRDTHFTCFFPYLMSLVGDAPICSVMFSIMQSGTLILPHFGAWHPQ